MKTINLKEIIEKQNLDTKEVAEQLFPNNKYPKLALDRVLSGKAFLDTNQMSKLSMLTGIPIEKLYSGSEWKPSNQKGIHKFTNGEYVAELDTKTWITKIYKNDSLFHEAIISDGSIALSVYLSELTSIINKNK
jgi:hypothetical protein